MPVHPAPEDTIVAQATAAGAAGLAVVRLSGPRALGIAAAIFRGSDLERSESHRAHHGWAVDAQGERLDEVLALVLRAPGSYTGEDTVELSCHGSPQVVEEIVDAALAAGARLAGPGEFTRRAFLNGRLDLTQAEAVADLIAAESRAARRAALEQLRGRLSQRLGGVRADLVRILADVEASIDFVEEGLEFFDRARAAGAAAQAEQQLDALLATAADGMLLRAGVRVSMAGAPNVGKSSLFNRILQNPRSIVTEHPGTTRDVVSESLRVAGLLLVLEDTAGLRPQTADPVEAIGIERSRRSHAEADVVLHVLDASRPLHADEASAVRGLRPDAALLLLNKVDLLREARRAELLGGPVLARRGVEDLLAPHGGAGVELPSCIGCSAETGAGIETILEELARLGRLRRLALQNDALVCINQRHREVLLRAREALQQFQDELQAEEPPEILAADLRAAVTALGEISGEQVTEEILDSIFARFCIGK